MNKKFQIWIDANDQYCVKTTVLQEWGEGTKEHTEVLLQREYKSTYVALEQAKNAVNRALKKV